MAVFLGSELVVPVFLASLSELFAVFVPGLESSMVKVPVSVVVLPVVYVNVIFVSVVSLAVESISSVF